MKKLLLIDGNSIMNRAFYGIMGSKMLTTKDGKYTNAVYGFLAIMFKILEDIDPDYMAVSFDLRAKTKRHELYSEYKANRHGMPNELAEQMPLIKEILNAMNIDIVEKEGFEGDDIIGTLAKYGEKNNLQVVILSGDRDTFQLASNKITIRIPRTKAGKTETEDYDRKKIIEEYGIEPKSLIEVKGLQGDSSDNIPGVPGVGPKTAISLIKKYKTIQGLYDAIDNNQDDLKGKQKENIINNRKQAFLSRKLGEINTKVPLEETLENLKVEQWNNEEVYKIFKELNFKRYIERFNLEEQEKHEKKEFEDLYVINKNCDLENVLKIVKSLGKCVYYFETEKDENPEKILKQKIKSISIYNYEKNEVYYINKPEVEFLKRIFEDESIEKYGFEMNYVYILLKQIGIDVKNLKFDVAIAAYILNSSDGKYPLDKIIEQYLEIDISDFFKKEEKEQEQLTLFEIEDNQDDEKINKFAFYSYCIYKLSNVLKEKLEENDELDLFENIDMPTVQVLGDMQ